MRESRPATGSVLIGRDDEVARLETVLDGLASGRGEALVISGAPGIGKSALLLHLRRRADSSGINALSIAGVEAEAELAFAGLQQLLLPLADQMNGLPRAPKRALMAGVGLAEG